MLSDSLRFQDHINKVYYVLTQHVVTILQNYCFVSPKLKSFYNTIRAIKTAEFSTISDCSTMESETGEKVKLKNISVHK